MAPIRCWQVDAFTNRPFGGNPAAVCLLELPADPAWMQAVAEEMNLSETAFVRRVYEGFELRWFTPTVEVDLCGHATELSAYQASTRGGKLHLRVNGDRVILGGQAVTVWQGELL